MSFQAVLLIRQCKFHMMSMREKWYNLSHMEKVELALASDQGAFCGLLVAVCTAASCANKGAELVFHILDGGIGDEDFSFLEKCLSKCNANASVNRVRVSQDDFTGFPSYHGSKMTYARLLLPRILSDVKRVVYFDTDFYWRADVVELWNESADVVSLAAAPDQYPHGVANERRWFERNGVPFPEGRYFCAGICVIDLDRWRADAVMDRSLEFLRSHPTVECADQTALNAILSAGEVQLLPVRWGRFVRPMTPAEFKVPMALHFASDAPWSTSRATKMMTDAQLLWFRTNAELRAMTLWQSLRRHYSPFEIIRYRLTYLLVMRLPPVRWLFHLFMARTGRGYFDERVDP